MTPEDPGPPPDSLVVRAEREGFYARLWPRPALGPWRIARSVAGILVVAGGVGALTGDELVLQVQIAALLALFLGLLYAFSLGPGFVPVEITVDDHAVNWGGERFAIPAVRDCLVRDGTLELMGTTGTVLARIDGVDAAAGRWLSLAIRASLPEREG